MSRDVLDLIDSTLDDYATSCDAVRWAPDAPDPTPSGGAFQVRCYDAPRDITSHPSPAPPPLPVTIRLTCLITPAGWKLGLDRVHLKAQLRRQHGKRKAGQALRRLAAVLNPPPPPAHPRIRRMHTEYRRRNRGR